ncbi:MAG: glycoside hydrolase family 127 protein [Phycisphaerae bacterium]
MDRSLRAGFGPLLGGVVIVAGCTPSAGPVERASATGPVGGPIDHYVANRPPLVPSAFARLPIGSIRPEGWLRGQLERMAEGMTGRLDEISPWCRFEGSAWTDPKGEGTLGWEELPYWLKGYIDLGYVLDDRRIIERSRRWIEAALASRRPDGYFGPAANRAKRDLWPNMCMLYALRTYHEATGDQRVIDLMTAYFKWQSTLPLEDILPESWQKIRGGDNLDSIYWLYNRTGEAWLLNVARVNHERTADWAGGVASWHGVNISECFREPGQYYQQTADPRYLKAVYRNYDTVWGLYGQVPGGGFGADENCRRGYIGPRQGTETCTWVELIHSFLMLTRIAGDPLWIDRCEEVAFNSLPAASTPDLKALHYLTAPNQVQLDRQNKSPMIQNDGDMFSYSPFEQYRCCQHNVAMGWPYYAQGLWMAAPGNGLAAVLYAESSVKARVGPGKGVEIAIQERTDYPFGETVEFKLDPARPVAFPLVLRVPGWCSRAAVSVNGQAERRPLKAGTWVTLERTWSPGDVVRLELPMDLAVKTWEKNRNVVSVHRGPITYSLKIGERWAKYGGNEQWPCYEVFPTTPWNYGLIVDAKAPAGSFEVVRKAAAPLPAQPFTPEAAPLQLKARARRIPEWKLEANGMVGEILASPVKSGEPVEEVTLIPMGCARLRISAFPAISDGPDARKWEVPSASPSASHVHPGDTLAALTDGIEPSSSSDQSIPRFTWWDHRGTREWVQLTFPQPRNVAWVEVYWYDDTRQGRHCAAPAAWRVQWLDHDTWRNVEARAADHRTRLDRYNRVEFRPVTTAALRLDVQLAPDYSGGILEWKAGE